jgi:hypothetical protein
MMISDVCLWLASTIYIWMKEAPQPSNTTKIAVMRRGYGGGKDNQRCGQHRLSFLFQKRMAFITL